MTVAEVLKQSGMTDEQIAAIDAKAIASLDTFAATATADRTAGEVAQRAAAQLFENEINPALNKWGNDEANLKAERDYYKAQAAGAAAGGFVAAAPPFTPRADDGRFVANTNQVPGSPNLEELESRVGGAIGALSDLQWKYQKLFGTGMPDSPTTLLSEATAQRLPLVAYAAKKYDFAGKEAALAAAERKTSEDAIRKEERESRDKFWAERSGSNPNIRQGEVSRFAEMTKGVTDGTRVDPLKMTREQRHAQTAKDIRRDVAAQTIQ